MCDMVNKMLNLMKPYVCNINEEYEVLHQTKIKVSALEKFVAQTEGVAMGLLDVKDIHLLTELLNTNDSSIEEYQANSYILKSPIKEVMNLPQYEEAQRYMEKIYDQIKNNLCELQVRCKKLDDDYKSNMIIDKYYKMFFRERIFVQNGEEFKNMLNKLELSVDDKNLLMVYILKENNKMYIQTGIQEEFNNDEQSEIENVLKKNSKFLSSEYNELLNVVSEYVNLTRNIKEIVSEELINKININNILLAKQIWLLKKLAFNYYNLHCRKCNEIMKEFKNVSELLTKVSHIDDKKEVIRMIKGDIDNER